MNTNTKQILYGALVVVALFVFAVLVASFGNRASQNLTGDNEVETGEPISGTASYRVDTLESEVVWSGSRSLLVDYTHEGSINVATGTVSIVDGEVSSARVVLDMKTIKTTADGEGAPAGGSTLDTHLKSADFFDVNRYPASVFVLTSATPTDNENEYNVTGNLTIKNVTKAITFPAQIYMENGDLHIYGDVTVDRTLWDIRYGSGKFFQDIGDKAIDDEFTLNLAIVARAPFGLNPNSTGTSTASTTVSSSTSTTTR